ncbi:PDZ DHR GLGF domain-containing protein [Lentilactobacillus rapi DSM 19907 = JCM 15042]|uniref:Membrane protein n=2 Tax=Lentilactobacillus rapi TaxID=481723 RepID=A0A512PKC6_9LACO|nr:PDZ domain-containing protein [Lentilactobacillus rapi]KRL18675.1 PDZ DHR GLGF domain-containing protein [Lentilactobacillus rapi DSM 19907 = JCM 15042]GEP71659.1 membrane protein [Lentilactobacillus rapi]
MKIIIATAFYILQPALWIGVIRAYLIHNRRVKQERSLFSSAIYEDFYEGRHFVRSGLLFGILASIVFGGFLSVSITWVMMYELISLVCLLFIPGQILSITIVSLVGLLVTYVPMISQLQPLENMMSRFGFSTRPVNSINFLILTVVALLLTSAFIGMNAGKFDSPTISRNKRNTKVAIYKFNELTIFPFLLLVPGDWFTSRFSFLPFFQINGHSYAFLILPMLIGLKLTVRKSVPREFFVKLSKRILVLSLLGILLTIAGIFYQVVIAPAVAILLLGYYLIIGIAKHQDHQVNFEYSEVMDGIRVIGIQPGTPAAKMDLKLGDVILSVNNITVNNEDEFYRALSTNSTYCRFKVRDRNDQLKITESAIFKNSPHEIGVKTYSQVIK